MGRRPLVPVSLDDACGRLEERCRAAAELEAWAAKPSRRMRSGGTLSESIEDARRMMSEGCWDGAMPRHFVALWAICHERVYRVSAESDLKGMALKSATHAAGRMLREEFGGDASEMAAFIRWCWVREDGKDRWCREKGFERRARIEWRKQFNGALLADWRLDMVRKEGRV